MAEQDNDKKKDTKRRSLGVRKGIHDAFMGRLLTVDLLIRHWKTILLAVVLVMIYINNRYQCVTRMGEIKNLNDSLEVAKTEYIRSRSEYMSRIREAEMQRMVREYRLGLDVQEQPPYSIEPR